MVHGIVFVALLKILIFSPWTLRMTITLQVRMEACVCGGALEIIRIGAGDAVKTKVGVRT